jgi:hypothetical protein
MMRAGLQWFVANSAPRPRHLAEIRGGGRINRLPKYGCGRLSHAPEPAAGWMQAFGGDASGVILTQSQGLSSPARRTAKRCASERASQREVAPAEDHNPRPSEPSRDGSSRPMWRVGCLRYTSESVEMSASGQRPTLTTRPKSGSDRNALTAISRAVGQRGSARSRARNLGGLAVVHRVRTGNRCLPEEVLRVERAGVGRWSPSASSR